MKGPVFLPLIVTVLFLRPNFDYQCLRPSYIYGLMLRKQYYGFINYYRFTSSCKLFICSYKLFIGIYKLLYIDS